MPSENCRFHQKGHCYNKSFCKSNHDIKVCPQNLLCNQQDSCQFRHVKICPKFPYCGFQNSKGFFIIFQKCSYVHPPLQAPYLPQPHPPPYPNIVRPLFPASPRMEYLESQVWKLTTELAAVKNTVTSNAARREEVTPQITSDNIEMQNLTNKKAGETEVHSSSDEHNVSVKLDNILTISEDNGNEAPGGSGDDKKNLKPKTKGKRSWWQWSTDPPDPPPTSGAESGANTEKVLEGTPDDHLQLQHNDKNPDPGAARAQEQLANLTSKFTAIETSQQEIKNVQQNLAEKSAQSVTQTELQGLLRKHHDFIKVNNFDRLLERIEENEVETEKDLKNVEKESDRLIQELENRLEVKITNLQKSMKKQTTDLETKLGSRIINSSAQMQDVAEKIQDQLDSLKREEDTALVAADDKLAEQTDNTETLKHLKNTQQAILETLKTINFFFSDLQRSKSFQHFSHKLTDYKSLLKKDLFKINSFLPEPISE